MCRSNAITTTPSRRSLPAGPESFEGVGSNLFGDILSDLDPALAGTIGIAPSA